MFICEKMIVSVLGGLAAIDVSLWGVPIIRNSMPEGISKYVAGWSDIHVDGSVLGLTLIVVVVVGILFGFGAAFQTSRLNVNATLKERSKGAGTGSGQHRLRSALVIAEVVLSMVLLVGAGLTIKGFQHLVNVFQDF